MTTPEAEKMKAEPLSEQELADVRKKIPAAPQWEYHGIFDRLLATIEKLRAETAHSNPTPTSAEVEELTYMGDADIPVAGWPHTDELPDPELRRAMEILCRRLLNVDLTISQHREMARGVENWFRNKGYRKPALPAPAEGAMVSTLDLVTDYLNKMEEWNRLTVHKVEGVYTGLAATIDSLLTAREAAVREALAFSHQTNAALQTHMGKTRMPGTVEVCQLCGNKPSQDRCYGATKPRSQGAVHPECPIRAGGQSNG